MGNKTAVSCNVGTIQCNNRDICWHLEIFSNYYLGFLLYTCAFNKLTSVLIGLAA